MNNLNILKKIFIFSILFFLVGCSFSKSDNLKTDVNGALKLDNIKQEDINFLQKKEENSSKTNKENEELKINFVTPKGKITDLTKNITVRFNQPVVSLTSFDKQEKCPIVIEPELKGKCVWITTSTFQFIPEQGFPIGAKYKINFDKNFESINKKKISNISSFEIETPEFKLLDISENLKNKDNLKIIFNDEVDLENFKNHFEIQLGLSKKIFKKINNYQIKYYKEKNEFDELVEKKNIILITKNNKSWGYEKEYKLIFKKGLKNIRGNIGFENEEIKIIKTEKILEDYGEFLLKDKNKDFDINNIYEISDKNIITLNKPIIGLKFSEIVPKQKSLFEITVNGRIIDYSFYESEGFNKFVEKSINQKISRLSEKEKTKEKIKELKDEGKTAVFIKLNKILEENSKVKIKIKASKFSTSKDFVLDLATSEKNKIESFEFKNYKLSCIYFKKEIYRNYYGNSSNLKDNFSFNGDGEIINYREIYDDRYNKGDEYCEYKKGLFGYRLNTLLTPEKEITLNISSKLIDKNIYPLDKNYQFKFKTGKIKNDDKYLSIQSYGNFKIFSKYSEKYPFLISTQNLDKIKIEVCNGNINLYKIDDFISNDKKCVEKIIDVENKGFEVSSKIIDLKEIFGKDFDKQVIKVNVSKLEKDFYIEDKKNRYYYYENKNSFNQIFLINKTNAIIKATKDGELLWLTDLKTGKTFKSNDILKIETNSKKYNNIGKFYYLVGKGNLGFEDTKNGFIKLIHSKETRKEIYLITLKSGEKILTGSPGSTNSSPEKVYIFLDKTIYKPGDTLHLKGFVREDSAEGLKLFKTKYGELKIRRGYYDEIISKKVEVSDIGGFEFSYKIPKDAKLGRYIIEIGNEEYGFNIEKFEKPDFKINLKSDKKIYKYGEEAKIDVFGEYYLGAPLINGVGEYTIKTKKLNFSPENFSNYLWGENKNYFYKCFYFDDIEESFEYLKDGEVILDNNGKAKINLNLEGEENKIYKIDMILADPKTQKTTAKSIDFKAFNSDKFAGMQFDKYFYKINDEAKIKFVVVDKDGNKLNNTSLSFNVLKSKRVFNEDTSKYETKKENLFSKTIKTDSNGFANINYKIKDFGEIVFEVNAINNNFKTNKTFYIYGNDKLEKKENSGKLNIFPEKQKYKVGEKAKINILSDIKGKLLITIEKQDKIFETKIVDFDKNHGEYEFEVKKEYLPNFYVNAILVGKNSSYYEKGNIIVKVDREYIKLNTKVITDKNEYLPGDKQIIELEVKDSKGNNIDGEATISIVDESLLAIKAREGDSIIDYFYDKKPNYINTNNLIDNFVKKIKLKEIKRKNIQKSFKNLGIKSASMALAGDSFNSMKMAKTESLSFGGLDESEQKNNSTKIRKDFKDIAHYFGTIKIVNGKAKVVVDKLPDNLTTWVIDGFVITKDTKVGLINKKFKVKKDLSIIPSLPRFFMLNDEFEIKTIILNNSNKDFEVESILEISNAEILEKPKNIVVPKKSQKVVKWKVKIKPTNDKKIDTSEIKIIAKAKNNLIDSVILKRDIKAYSTPETVFTNGKTDNISYEEKIFLDKDIDKNFGSLKISMGASILANLTGKIEDILSKNIWFNSYFLVKTVDEISSIKNLYKVIGEEKEYKKITIKDENKQILTLDEVIEKFLKDLKIYISDYYYEEGGIKYSKNCYDKCVDFNLTIKTLKVLNKLEKLSYNIDKQDKNKIISYIKKEIENRIEKAEDNKIYDIKALIVLVESGEKEFVLGKLDNLEIKNDNLGKLDKIKLYRILGIKNNEIKNIIKELKNNVLIEARGSILSSGKYTDNLSTAKALIEFIKNNESEKLLIQNFARFIVGNNLGKNSSGNTQQIDAIALYIQNSGELQNIDFTAKAYLDHRNIFTQKFDSTNKFKTYIKDFALKDYIRLGKENSLGFTKKGDGVLYYDVNLAYFLPIEKIEPRDEGLILSRKYYKMDDYLKAYKKECYYWGYYYGGNNNCYFRKIKEIDEVKNAKSGDMLVGEIELITPRERNNVVIENFIPAGAELLNTSLDNTADIAKEITGGDAGYYGFTSIENYEDKLFMFARKLYSGTYKYTYVIKVNHNGKFHNKPAVGYLLDTPEVWGRTGGSFFEVSD